MLAVPSAVIVSASLVKLSVANLELSGIQPARDTLALIQLTQQHRGLSATLLGGKDSLAAARLAKQAEVGHAMALALTSSATLGDVKVTALVDRISTEWHVIANGVGSKSMPGPQSFSRHTALIADQLSLLEDITIVSGIVFHPESSGYFLQAGVLTHLPKVTETLGQIRALGALMLARGDASPQERARIEALAIQTRSHYRDARKALDLALQGNPMLLKAIEPARR